jgi:hypothetical protein
MLGLELSRRVLAIAAGGGLLAVAGVGAGIGIYLHSKPVLHIASSAEECINAPDHIASLYSDDENTLIRLSDLDWSNLQTLRVEPASSLPGMFDSLLALSSDSKRLAYVTASSEQMDGARLLYIDTASPDPPHLVTQIASGLTPVRPAWSPDASVIAYVIGRPPAAGKPAGFEVWSARADAALPPQKVADLPLDVFARGHSASLCWTPSGQIGLLQGVESARGQPGPSPLTGRGAASEPRTETPSPSPSVAPAGSPCGVPVFSQNDPSWQSLIMLAAGDPIGAFGCALTSTTMLLNYYGAPVSVADLNTCLGPSADPIIWQQAPVCTQLKVQGGDRVDFGWDALDAFLKAGKPVIVGMVRGITGSHFVVVTQGGGQEADRYSITDPWDGSTSKSLASYFDTGYNPRWIISYDGPGHNCARLIPGAPVIPGFKDGGVYNKPVSVTVPKDGKTTIIGQSNAPSAPTSPSPSPSVAASASPSPSPSPVQSPLASPSPSPSPSRSSSPSASKSPRPSPKVSPAPGSRVTLNNDGVYIFVHVLGRHITMEKVTIDTKPPEHIFLEGINRVAASLRAGLFAYHRPAADSSGLVLVKPGKLRVHAIDMGSGVDTVSIGLDGGAPTPYSNDSDSAPVLTVPDVGTHTIVVQASDLAQNVAQATLMFDVVDTTPSPSPSPSESPTPTPTRRPTNPPATNPPPPPPSFSVSQLSVSISGPPPPTNCGPSPCCSEPSLGIQNWSYVVSATITNSGGPGTATFQWLRTAIMPPQSAPPAAGQQQVQLGAGASVHVTDTIMLTVTTMSFVQLNDQLAIVGGASSNAVTLACDQA